MTNLAFEPRTFEDLAWWIAQDRKKSLKIVKLLEDIQRHPFTGLGLSEPLKRELSGCWARWIDEEHRLVYEVLADRIKVLACRYHY